MEGFDSLKTYTEQSRLGRSKKGNTVGWQIINVILHRIIFHFIAAGEVSIY